MITYTRFKVQRIMRHYQRAMRVGWRRGQRYLRFNLFGKWRQLAMIRRFVSIWWVLLLISLVGLLWQMRGIVAPTAVFQPLPGGSYSEAVVGAVKNINPILPEGSASADVTHLIFSGLTRFNTAGQLEPDLATSWQISSDGRTYTFHIRPHVVWQDGVPFTAQDVTYTLAAIQNPDTRSPLAASWQGVKVSAPDSNTVVFQLPKPYTPFLDATTVGILPRHLLAAVAPAQLQVTAFNQNPIGTGPFKVTTFDPASGEISLSANPTYYFGRPLLDSVALHFYTTSSDALAAYTHKEVEGVARLQPGQVADARGLGTLSVEEATLPDEVAVFLQTTTPILQDKAVRLALTQATDRATVVKTQLAGEATALTSPLVASQLNLVGAPHQAAFNVAAANATLAAAGWQRGIDGIRSKGSVRLELHLVTQADDSTYVAVAQALVQQWRRIGVQLDVTTVDATTLQQSYIRTRHYDALLYGISEGADPDVYAYWDSSQIKDPGLNLSDYSSPAADKALETGRVVSDPTLRAAKYRAFVAAFVADSPAVMLYTPTYVYGIDSSIYGATITHLITPADRFTGIEKWAVRGRTVER